MLYTGLPYEVLLERSRGWLKITHANILKSKLQDYKLQEYMHRLKTKDLADIGEEKKSAIDFREQKNFDIRNLESFKIGYKKISGKKNG